MQGVLYAAVAAAFVLGLFFVDSYRRRGSHRATADDRQREIDSLAEIEKSEDYAQSARRVAEAEAVSIRQLAQTEADAHRRAAAAESEALRRAAQSDAASATSAAQAIRDQAKTDAAGLIAEAKRTAEAEVARLTDELRETERELAAQAVRARLEAEAADLDRAVRQLTERQRELDLLSDQLTVRLTEVDEREANQIREIERVAGLTAEEAKAELITAVEASARRDAAVLVRSIETEARAEGTERARAVVVEAVQRVASEQTTETVVSVLHLPGDEMKGRIIGREGRNIRAFEAVTGVNVIIDDTPEAVLLSCFDPVRREVGRLTLEKLIVDGRRAVPACGA